MRTPPFWFFRALRNCQSRGVTSSLTSASVPSGQREKSDMAIAIDASQGIAFPLDRLSGTTRTKVIDRWIYVFTATSFIVIVLTGFVPDSIARIAGIRAGTLAPFPLALHFHAVLMGSFLLLLLGQTVLVAMDKRNWHMQLGIAAVVLIPAVALASPRIFGGADEPKRNLLSLERRDSIAVDQHDLSARMVVHPVDAARRDEVARLDDKVFMQTVYEERAPL
jgi:hypothetical protein